MHLATMAIQLKPCQLPHASDDGGDTKREQVRGDGEINQAARLREVRWFSIGGQQHMLSGQADGPLYATLWPACRQEGRQSDRQAGNLMRQCSCNAGSMWSVFSRSRRRKCQFQHLKTTRTVFGCDTVQLLHQTPNMRLPRQHRHTAGTRHRRACTASLRMANQLIMPSCA